MTTYGSDYGSDDGDAPTTTDDGVDALLDDMARDLIRALASVAGNRERVQDVFAALFETVLDQDEAVHIGLTALQLVFTDCITGPSSLDRPVPLDIP